MEKGQQDEKKRIQIDLQGSALVRMEKLRNQLGGGTKATYKEVMLRSLALLEFVSDAQQEGETLLIKDVNGDLHRLTLL